MSPPGEQLLGRWTAHEINFSFLETGTVFLNIAGEKVRGRFSVDDSSRPASLTLRYVQGSDAVRARYSFEFVGDSFLRLEQTELNVNGRLVGRQFVRTHLLRRFDEQQAETTARL